ncbi:MAG: Holliday junction resolvase RuvX [Phycisphaerales bacterium]|nr:Holliday junction resolvase RuvX [Phycisphaerales bacterium]
MRYVGIDLGDKRTGLAVGDAQTGLVTPLKTVDVPLAARTGRDLAQALTRAFDDQVGAAELVLGLPLNMDGTEGPRARVVRGFGTLLAALSARVLHYQDERLTSAEADWAMAGSGLTHARKKARRDGLAAAAVLGDFLRTRHTGQ